MKTIILTSTLTLFSFTGFSQIIGKIVNNQPVITADIPKLCQTLSENLKNQSGIQETFSSARIFKKDSYYILEFKGKKYFSSFRVIGELNGDLNADGKTTCVTSGRKCAEDNYGCRPTAGVGDCICLPCPEGEVCTKTCSSFSLLQYDTL